MDEHCHCELVYFILFPAKPDIDEDDRKDNNKLKNNNPLNRYRGHMTKALNIHVQCILCFVIVIESQCLPSNYLV